LVLHNFSSSEHFLSEEGKFVEDKEGFLPFGIGIRKCPGEIP
jgi:hypothetical protein